MWEQERNWVLFCVITRLPDSVEGKMTMLEVSMALDRAETLMFVPGGTDQGCVWMELV